MAKIISNPSVKAEELLEKMIAGLSSDIYQKNRVYKNDFMRLIAKVEDMNFSTKRQGLLLIRCCGDLLPDESPASRMVLVEQVWKTLKWVQLVTFLSLIIINNLCDYCN